MIVLPPQFKREIMALTQCKECKKELSTQAKFCPHCGAKPTKSVGPLGIVLALVVGVAVYQCNSRPAQVNEAASHAISASDTAIQALPAVPALTSAERERIITTATASLSLSRDKMEKVSFYQLKKRNLLSTRLEAYISVPDDSRAILRLSPVYYGDDWVFVDRIKVMADDEVVYEHDMARGELIRSNYGGSVWETGDYVARAIEIVALRKIASSKTVMIRFTGRERQHDHTMTRQEISNLTVVLKAFDGMKAL